MTRTTVVPSEATQHVTADGSDRPRTASTNDAAPLGARTAFLVWGTPDKGPRSRVLARELGIDHARAIPGRLRRTRLTALPRYVGQAVETVWWLGRVRPRLLFVQHPPSPAAWLVAAWAGLTGGRYVIDAHSVTFQERHWQWPAPVHAWLMRGATLVLVTNEHWAQVIRELGGQPFVVPDVPVEHRDIEPWPDLGRRSVAVVNTWAPDEPIDQIVEAAGRCEDVEFYITGRSDRVAGRWPALPPNVRFTGFLSEARYLGLLASAGAVMCLTTRDDTMQRGACEALSLGTPVITSDTPILRGYFRQGAVHVGTSPDRIRAGVEDLMEDWDRFTEEIRALRQIRVTEWDARRAELVSRLVAPGAAEDGIQERGGAPR